MDQEKIDSQNAIQYLHLDDESHFNPSRDAKIAICKLWKLCLLNLYGGSTHHKEWCRETYKAVVSNLMPAKDGSLSCELRTDDMEHLGSDEFNERVHVVVCLLDNDKTMEQKSQIFAKDLIKIAISHGVYDARYRVVVKKLSKTLEIDWNEIDNFEQSLVEELVKIKSQEEEKDKQRQNEQNKRHLKRAFVIGLTAVGGGAILALSAGLAAPLIGAGAVAVLGSGSAAIFTGASGLAVITSIFGAAGAGLAGYKMTKRIGKIEQFEFGSLSSGKHLHVTLAVSGFCGDEDDGAGFSTPWEALDNSTEQYFLKWEGKYLRRLGSSIIDFVKREAMQAAVKGILKYTALRAVLKSIAWPLTLISAANLIDNPWNVCTQRSKETGIQLAHVLLSRHQGYRPVTLIGFSLGARVIFYCLQTMLNEKDYQGIIEDVILIGAPVGVSTEEWEAFESIISGTLYNCYSRSDWLLKFVYRAASVQVGDIAGLGPISVSWQRLINIDLTDMVNSHSEYAEPAVISDILQLIGYKTKPVQSKVQASAVKLPHEFVRDISRTPTKILPPNFSSTTKEKQQPELTAEEQETLDRLTSCQNSNVIDSLKSKSAVWKGEDSDGNSSENGSPSKQSTWQKVVSMTKRSSLPSERKPLLPANHVQLGWKIGCEDNETDASTMEGSMHSDSTTRRSSAGIVQGSDNEINDRGQCSKSNSRGLDLESDGDRCNDDKTVKDGVLQGEVDGMEKRIGENRSDDQGSTGQDTENSQRESINPNADRKADKCVLLVNDEERNVEIESLISENSDTLAQVTANLPNPARAERSKSSSDIKSEGIGDTHMSIPGKELFNKMRRNMKFALPSPTIGRRSRQSKETVEKELPKTALENEATQETFRNRALRKMSFPGSL